MLNAAIGIVASIFTLITLFLLALFGWSILSSFTCDPGGENEPCRVAWGYIATFAFVGSWLVGGAAYGLWIYFVRRTRALPSRE